MAEPLSFRSYRTPSGDGQTLVEPRVCCWSKLVIDNRRLLDRSNVTFVDRTLSDLRTEARKEIFESAFRYTRNYLPENPLDRPIDRDLESIPLLVSGHQPELFHPGVWFKNFLLDASSRSLQGIGINVLIDHDLCRSLRIKHPVRESDGRLRLAMTEVERIDSSTPWERLSLGKSHLLESFPERLTAEMRSWTNEPLIARSFWKSMKRHGDTGVRDGLMFARARHEREHAAGLRNLEVPFSSLAGTRSFSLFFSRIVAEMEKFRTSYNRNREIYREFHRIRNQVHPVPELGEESGWSELPFWFYSSTKPKRVGLWCRRVGRRFELSDREGWSTTWNDASSSEECWLQWQEMIESGVCIRPRALTTTMYLRLLASDLFMHGIGGAKYDQLTDMILREWLGITEVPRYVVASATVRLAIDLPSTEMNSPRSIRQQWWHDRFHAEKLVGQFKKADAQAETRSNSWQEARKQLADLSDRKLQLLDKIPARGNKREWHRAITDVNRRLEDAIEPHLDGLLDQIPIAEQGSRQRAIATSREYSIIVYPETLIDRLSAMALDAQSQTCQSSTVD